MIGRDPTRRECLRWLVGSGLGVGAWLALPAELRSRLLEVSPARADEDRLREILATAPEARFWSSTAGDACVRCHEPDELPADESFDHGATRIRCQLCAQQCLLTEGERGRCRARMVVDGRLRTLVYGRPLSVHVDPIEKKPFYHFLPGSTAFSLSTAGCPLRCRFCQNWEISQARPEDHRTRWVGPEEVVGAGLERSAPVIAFTYNEPTVFTEYLLDIARAGLDRGLRSVLVSCGFMESEPLREMCACLSAIKIDLKGFDPGFYRDVCEARLDPVLRSLRQVNASGVHLEIVNLVVPTLNDSERMMSELCRWVVGELGPDVPVHFTRFHPDYQLRHLPPTPVRTLERARELALEAGMHFPFVGNVPGHPGNHSYCPACGEILIRRRGFIVEENRMRAGACGACGQPIPGVWS